MTSWKIDMDEKFKKRVESILDFYSIALDRNSILNDILEVVQEAYSQGWSDAKDDSFEEDYLKDDGNWIED